MIGLEVHAQLRTASKLFSPAPVSYGVPPNHSVHPICLALPQALVNREICRALKPRRYKLDQYGM